TSTSQLPKLELDERTLLQGGGSSPPSRRRAIRYSVPCPFAGTSVVIATSGVSNISGRTAASALGGSSGSRRMNARATSLRVLSSRSKSACVLPPSSRSILARRTAPVEAIASASSGEEISSGGSRNDSSQSSSSGSAA